MAEETVLKAIESFDPEAEGALLQPLIVIDASGDADNFNATISSTLAAIIKEKWVSGKLEYVSGLGTRGREYAVDRLYAVHGELDLATRELAKEALQDWRYHRYKRLFDSGGSDFASGIGIIRPVSGARLHFDLAIAALLA
ncbi:hypothetical protein [Parerythrobacter aestuarii]|uniref:hypothetical protein n=1 Tax=Parerythrobacter aestuarii TaxID=3020909 RepID=UPI0024DE45E5|nr:hypothetical protein [Parerythrobacter aestuarii]